MPGLGAGAASLSHPCVMLKQSEARMRSNPTTEVVMPEDKAAPVNKVVTMDAQIGRDGQFKEGRGTAITSLPVMAAVAADAPYTTPPGGPSAPAAVAAAPAAVQPSGE